MENMTIADIYAANDQIRQNLKSMVGNISETQAQILPEGEKWTLAQFVEHIGIVEGGMSQICGKLLAAAQSENKASDGSLKLSDEFKSKAAEIINLKLEAPERVLPSGAHTLAQSLAKLDENRAALNEMRPLFESLDGTEHKFPHPFLGNLTAHEWLLMIGRHESRHTEQLKKYLEKLS